MITLKTLPFATAQEVYDQVRDHLLKQNKKSKNPSDPNDGSAKCVYRSGELRCAAGCLIGDDEYTEEMDYSSDSGWESLSKKGIFPKEHVDLIAALQSIHDNRDPSDWKMSLERLAARRVLNP